MEIRQVRSLDTFDAVQFTGEDSSSAELVERLKATNGITHAWFTVSDWAGHPVLSWYVDNHDHVNTAREGDWLIFVGWPEYVVTDSAEQFDNFWEEVDE